MRSSASSDLILSNLLDDELEYEIMNDTLYFKVEIFDPATNELNLAPNRWRSSIAAGQGSGMDGGGGSSLSLGPSWCSVGTWTIPSLSQTRIKISPMQDVILRNAEALRKVKRRSKWKGWICVTF